MIIGNSEILKWVRDQAQTAARHNANVLLTGESGTGKDVVANMIHSGSGKQNFVAVNCAAIPETLVESTLFGHKAGAFTGASTLIGKLEAAHGGTLFLDEIGDLPLHLQTKLLRALETRTITRIGDNIDRPASFRLICATNRDLVGMVNAKTFRQDLFYRINVIHIQLPPLRSLYEDLNEIAAYLIIQICNQNDLSPRGLSQAARSKLMKHDWPGNIRELRNVLERAIVSKPEGVSIESEDIHLTTVEMLNEIPGSFTNYFKNLISPIIDYLCVYHKGNVLSLCEAMEQAIITSVMEKLNYNESQSAKMLGICRNTLRTRMEKYGKNDHGAGSSLNNWSINYQVREKATDRKCCTLGVEGVNAGEISTTL